jgi:2-dehydropantoate 2-reductase
VEVKLSASEKILVVGPGAMGLLFGGLLARAGHEVRLLDRREDRARSLTAQGIVIEQGEQTLTVPVRAVTRAEEAAPAGLIVICVKAYDTGAAARAAAPAAGPDTLVLSLQNGQGNVEALIEVFGPERVLGGTTAQGSNLAGTGRVRHAGQGETVVGEAGGGTERAARVAELMSGAGIGAGVTNDLEGLIWSKLTINAAINPLTALLRVKNGALAESEPALAIMRLAVAEVVEVCRRRGTKLAHPAPYDKAVAVARATANNISSMLQDVRAQRKTEVNYINGAVVKAAQELGVAAPVNEALTRLIEAVEAAYGRTL